jgi:hypothetical protein
VVCLAPPAVVEWAVPAEAQLDEFQKALYRAKVRDSLWAAAALASLP